MQDVSTFWAQSQNAPVSTFCLKVSLFRLKCNLLEDQVYFFEQSWPWRQNFEKLGRPGLLYKSTGLLHRFALSPTTSTKLKVQDACMIVIVTDCDWLWLISIYFLFKAVCPNGAFVEVDEAANPIICDPNDTSGLQCSNQFTCQFSSKYATEKNGYCCAVFSKSQQAK